MNKTGYSAGRQMWSGVGGLSREQGMVSQKSEIDEASQMDYQYDNSTQLS